ncbi:Nif11-like leader peptide family natural product precursor [Synechococcus sp. RSCCF101]|uniref:Nif11-like leader peptide family RiPP precursor n=1 Tax=Synechococcus sp. RSCCF101 TaxID=2511069 RepID=UPI0012461094|nr:Nif11-like leader peptide family natural product precursor [Synechococcus sp. RSCCF101]
MITDLRSDHRPRDLHHSKRRNQAKLKQAAQSAATSEQVSLIAKEAGFEISAADIRAIKAESSKVQQLSDQELEAVSGGGTPVAVSLWVCGEVVTLGIGPQCIDYHTFTCL